VVSIEGPDGGVDITEPHRCIFLYCCVKEEFAISDITYFTY
jgi:hypothetical protein